MARQGPDRSVSQVADETVSQLLQQHEELAEVAKQTLNLDEELAAVYFFSAGFMGVRCLLFMRIRKTFPDVEFAIAKQVAIAAEKTVTTALLETRNLANGSTGLLPDLLGTFTMTEYLGDAAEEFAEYLTRCWHAYRDAPKAYEAPYVTVVQSSGFGKSRLLFELAQDTMENDRNKLSMRVLHTCVRCHRSTGFPVVTPSLRDWLFGERTTEYELASHLLEIYHYAHDHWSTVGEEWVHLFTTFDIDDIGNKMQMHTNKKLNRSAEMMKQRADVSEKTNKTSRVVVLAVDEARDLFPQWNGAIDHFHLLRRALVTANERIRRTYSAGGIFAVLVDTSPSIALRAQPRQGSPSTSSALFPPFVLSHTMDIYLRAQALKRAGAALELDDEIPTSAYKSIVMEKNKEKAWSALVSMGRPMWATTYHSSRGTRTVAARNLVTFAAKKLLLGLHPKNESSYNAETVYGVASMLCRLGLRPFSTSTLASKVVADLMATLAYVNYKNDGLLCSYASDPILALGATSMWYTVDGALSKYLLPQLKQLLLNEVVDTGGVGEVVARIVLLLAVDTCVLMQTKVWGLGQCNFRGQFVSVHSFLQALGGTTPSVLTTGLTPASDKSKEAFLDWQSKWDSWQLGFCHFLLLDCEPDEKTLWFLLGRRAAGMFSRDEEGMYLLVPIFAARKYRWF